MVPLLPTYKSAPLAGSWPPQPTTRSGFVAGDRSMVIPKRPSASIISRVSSLSRAPTSSDSPPASAAQTSARFVMLFDPGGRILPRTGPPGRISISRAFRRLYQGNGGQGVWNRVLAAQWGQTGIRD